MVVLISGITGFLGRRVAADLAANSHTVRGLSRSSADAETRAPHADTLIAWDAASPLPAGALDGVDAVVHLAGESVVGRWSAAKKRAIRDSRVVSTRHIVDAIAAASPRPRRLVSASAIGYYGDRHEQVVDEDSTAGDGFLSEVCVAWEEEARRAPVDVTCLRIGVVLGEGGGALDAMLKPFSLGLGGPLGSGKQWWSWIHIDDIVGLVRHALEGDVGPTLNAVAPEPVRQDAFAKALARQLGRPAIVPAPAFAIRALLGGFSAELLTSRRVVPTRTLASGYEYLHPTLEGALSFTLSPPEARHERANG